MSHKSFNSVVITGIGLITPLGNSRTATWDSLISGRSGITLLGPEFGDALHAGIVTGEKESLDKILSLKDQHKTDRFTHLVLVAVNEAMTDAGFSCEFPKEREKFSCFLGIGIGGLQSLTEGVNTLLTQGAKRVSPFTIPRTIMSEACAWVSIKNNIQGQMCACANACSSSGDAVGFAFRAVRDGYADYAIAGGTEAAIVPIGVISFNNMRALSSWAGDPSKASRPFDKNRSGFVIAEGAAVMIFERKDLALARGAKIYGEIIGYGATSDAYHITAMHPEGLGAEQAIRLALTDANITPEDVGYINAHGTGTLMNDVIETSVIKRIFGSHADPANPGHVCVSSTKSMTGHMLGAAGASEGAFTVLALYNKILPPTINLDEPDPVCDLDYIANKSRLAPQIKFAISNTFGFGGGNSVLVFKRHEG